MSRDLRRRPCATHTILQWLSTVRPQKIALQLRSLNNAFRACPIVKEITVGNIRLQAKDASVMLRRIVKLEALIQLHTCPICLCALTKRVKDFQTMPSLFGFGYGCCVLGLGFRVEDRTSLGCSAQVGSDCIAIV